MIQFYQEEKMRREQLYKDERREKIKSYEAVVENLRYLIEVERQRTGQLISKVNARMRPSLNSLASGEESEISYRLSTDTILFE
jgi:hypothetical protein